MRVAGRRAVVTGAASGIGRSLAGELVRRGADVVLTDLDPDGLAATAEGLRGRGRDVQTLLFDVREREGWERVRDHLRERPAQLLFNNAGVSLNGPFLACPLDDLNWQIDINLRGVLLGCHILLPGMVAQPEAHVVNLSSLFGIISVPESAAYCMSKHAVKALSECLMMELPDHVHVTSVHPGAVATGIVTSSRFHDGGAIPQRRAKKIIERGLHPDEAARIILDGVEANRERVLVGRDARLLSALSWMFPERYRRLIRWQLTRRARS